MPEVRYVRVRTADAEFSVVESALPHVEGAEVLDKPGADASGDPLPPKLRRQRSSKASSSKGRKASETTEE